MDWELKLLLRVTRNLPRIKGSHFFASQILFFYQRKKRTPVISDILNFKMELDPNEWVDGGILFYPQLYDYREINFLRSHLSNRDIFLDIGANIGFYTLAVSEIVGDDGRVVSVEADPYNYRKLCINLELNKCQNVISHNIGVSDKKEQLRLGLDLSGNRGANSFLFSKERDNFINVECKPLLSIIEDLKLQKRISIAKIDIEGFEFRVLRQFLEDAESSIYPQYIIVEYRTDLVNKAGGDVIHLLKTKGYKLIIDCGMNKIMEYRDCPVKVD